MILDLEDTFTVGEDTYFRSDSPLFPNGVVFEDDLTTGYLYAITTDSEPPILDAVHIYNVENVIDKAKPCNIKIAWTDNGQLASLLINDYCHAIFDFKNKVGYCRNAFPPSTGEWNLGNDRIPLTDDLIIDLLK
jgi:hypothetical protein